MIRRRIPHLLLALALLLAALPAPFAAADGTLGETPNPIGAAYGSTRSIDADNDAACTDTQDRGDLIDFHAFSAPVSNGSRWFFAFVVDSDVALNAGGGIDQPNYFIILDDPNSAGANGADDIPFWSNSSPYAADWTRNMRTPGTHFVACYASGANQLTCGLYDNTKQPVSGVSAWTVTTATLGGRRIVELALPDVAAVPAYLRDNSAINTLLVSTYNSDNWGNPIDAAGKSVTLSCHNNSKELNGGGRDFAASEMVATAANCKSGGRPTDAGANDRQCLSFPARSITTPLNDIAACTAETAGLTVDGSAGTRHYTLLSEAGFAGPYQGGAADHSDFVGESASYQRCWGSNQTTQCEAVNADIVDVYARGDAYFLYLVVAGQLGSIASGNDDKANLFIALDLPDVASGSGEAVTVGAPGSAEFANAPGGHPVNFHGWDVDRVVELIWYGDTALGNNTNAAKLWRYTGSRAWASTDMTTVAGFNTATHTNQSPPANATGNLYYGRDTNTFEVAIPWAALGYTAWTAGSGANPPTCGSGLCRPALDGIIRVGSYTTYNDAAYDVYDQAPGIGQGCNGLGCHERLGDEWEDTDDDRSGGEADRSPYSGKTRGTYDVSSSDAGGLDVDTIESYFQLSLAPKDRECIPSGEPLAVALASFQAEAQADHVLVTWETVSELDNRGFNLYRGVSPAGPMQQLNAALIPSQAPGSPGSFTYTWEDRAGLVPGQTYTYWLEDLDVHGATTLHGPVSVEFSAPTAVTLGSVSASPAASGVAALPWLVAAAGAGVAFTWRRRR